MLKLGLHFVSIHIQGRHWDVGCIRWNGDSQSSWHIYLDVGTFRSHIKIKVINIQVCAVCHILFKAFYMDCLIYSSDTFGS